MRQWGRMLLAATAIAAIGATTAWAQGYDTASVPFIVNVDATVKAELKEGAAVLAQAEISATANHEAVLRIPLQKTDGVRFFGTQRQANTPSITVSRNGKVTVNLPTKSSYRNADVLLYTVNGKRILRYSASAANADGGATRPNLAPGVYLLSVKAEDDGVIASRLTHSGGGMSIKVAFGGENPASARQTAKSAATGYWTITVSATGYVDSTYAMTPVAGMNTLQEITLREVPDGEYTVTVFAGIGATGGGSYAPGSIVTITAGTIPEGQRFKCWTSTSLGVSFIDSTKATTAFIMPINAVTVTANFQEDKYTVTVSAGTGAMGSGDYAPGTVINITAGTHPYSLPFIKWTSLNSDAVFADANSATTTFIMPSADVSIVAVFGILFTDSRDGQTYRAVTIGSNVWMAENLNYVTSGGSWCYENDNSNCAKYGRLYDWATAMAIEAIYNDTEWGGDDIRHQGVCPNGWHLPSRQEWGDLAIAAGGVGAYGNEGGIAGTKLKSVNGWNAYEGKSGNGTDDYGFSALPGGYLGSPPKEPKSIGDMGLWWTATEGSVLRAYYRDMYYGHNDVFEINEYKGSGRSIRCIKDN